MRLRDFFALQETSASAVVKGSDQHKDKGSDQSQDKGSDRTTFYLEYLALHQYLGEPFLKVTLTLYFTPLNLTHP